MSAALLEFLAEIMSSTTEVKDGGETRTLLSRPVPKGRSGLLIAASLCLALIVIGFGLVNLGEEVYRGNIHGSAIVYEEGIFTVRPGARFRENRMTVDNGDIVCTLIDCVGETGIRWRDVDLSAPDVNELHMVVIDDGHTVSAYLRPGVDPTTLEGQHAESVFRRADALYNHLREDIRNELRFGYLSEHVPIEMSLDPL